jgi:hypothetical protein
VARRLESETCRSLNELGKDGQRVVEMLEAAAERLEKGGIKTPEIVCYCTREAFNSLLLLTDHESPSIRAAARDVLTVANRERDASPETALGRAIDELRQALDEEEGRNERRLAAVIEDRAGVEPVRFQADLFFRASRLIRSLNTGLHTVSTLETAEGRYEEGLEIIEILFEPITRRLSKVDLLAARTEISDDDIEGLEGLCADPRVAEYFFNRIDGPKWFTALRSHPLLQPRSARGFWPAAAYLQRLAESDSELVVQWMEEALKSSSTPSTHAVRYLWLAQRIGFPARRAVLTAIHRHPHPEVAQEAAAYVGAMQEPETADLTIVRIIEFALKLLSING